MREIIEQQIIGCLLQDNSLIKDTTLQSKHFTNRVYQLIFSEMKKLSQEDKSIDIYMLLERLYDKLDDYSDTDTIANLESKGNVHHFESYERELMDKYTKQRTKETLTKHIQSEDIDADTLIEELENIKSHQQSESGNLFDLYMRLHEEPHRPETIKKGISTGLMSLDPKITFVDTELTIIAARPSMGKTAFMIKLIDATLGKDVLPLVFSLEMGEESLVRRLLSQRLKIDSRVARHSSLLNNQQREKWQREVSWLAEQPHRIYSQIRTIPEIRTEIRRAKKEFPNKRVIVFIDYLTLLQSEQNFQSRNAEVGYFSRSLKLMAMDFNIPVISLAQLSRGVEQRPNKRPMLSDLRDSGEVEQDANNVMFLYRDAYYDPKTEKPNDLEVIIAKQREGPTGTVNLFYNKQTGFMRDN